MKGSEIYAISRSRSLLSKLPSPDEIERLLELTNERELLERISRKIGYVIQADSVEAYLKELVGRLAYELSQQTKAAKGEVKALVLENLKQAILSSITAVKPSYYTYYMHPLGEELIKRAEATKDVTRLKLGSSTYDALIKFPLDVWNQSGDVGLLDLAFRKMEINEILKTAGYSYGTLAMVELHDYSVCAFVRAPIADELVIRQKPRCRDLLEVISMISKKYHVEADNFDTLYVKVIYAASRNDLSSFSPLNAVSAIEILKLYEKVLRIVRNKIVEKIKTETAKKLIS